MITPAPSIDLVHYQRVIVAHRSDLAQSSFKMLKSGWDCDAVAVDGALVFKLPRHAAALGRLRIEAALLGLIGTISPITVPALEIIENDPTFSCHRMINGEQILPPDYADFSDATKDVLALDVARFFVAIHSIPVARAQAAGAPSVQDFASLNIVKDVLNWLGPADGWVEAKRTLMSFEMLTSDPHGKVFGHFDCHGWNMAFNKEHCILNGIFDFGDSGIGELHREFVYPSLLSPEHAFRVVDRYESLGGRSIDRQRLAVLISYHRLMELAAYREKPELLDFAFSNWKNWLSFAVTARLF